ncbi:MAG: NUDIX domain-containing protein [Candidatus Aenigmarchaeota archaeon]|nr:NUDIX domain-containing protein [Candidatus Aenigmarchaeota archaeon]
MDIPKKCGDEKIVYTGNVFEVVNQPLKIGERVFDFESVRRAPGVRLIIIRNGNVLLTKEYRMEFEGFDWRLPGGRVFDSLKEYQEGLENNEDIMSHALTAAKKECLEEAGLIVKKISHFHTSQCGVTIKWDLIYFVITDFKESPTGQQTEAGEIIYPEWKPFHVAKKMCINGDIKEDRTASVLLRFLSKE